MTTQLLIVYHSQSGHTEQMAQAVAQGARDVDELQLRVLRACEAGLDDLLWCDGLIIGTPENFGYMSGAIKDFLDRTYYPAQNKFHNKPYALFVSCGNDGSGAVSSIQRIAKGYPLKLVVAPLVCKGELDAAALMACHELGMTMAAGLSLGIY